MTWDEFSQLFDERKSYIAEADWEGLENHYRNLLRQFSASDALPKDALLPEVQGVSVGDVKSSRTVAEREIVSVDLSIYTTSLINLLEETYRQDKNLHLKAIYFEYDIDNNWESRMFLHDEYRPTQEQDDDWACDWITDLPGSSLPQFTELYKRHGSFDTKHEMEVAATLYLITRTEAAFGRAVSSLPRPSFAVCIGYHDQSEVTRIIEAT